MQSSAGVALLLCLSLQSMLLFCPQDAAGAACTAHTGLVGFTIKGEEPCTAEKIDEETFLLKSPTSSEDLPNIVNCTARISTAGPSYLVIQPGVFDVLGRSDVSELLLYNQRTVAAANGENIYLPSSQTYIKYQTSTRKADEGYDMKIRAQTTACHKVCDLALGDQGDVEELNYAPNTICEWWFTAPENCKIILEFSKFDVGTVRGNGSRKCAGDYLRISKLGDKLYNKPKTRSHCGKTLPGPIKSSANKMTILFNGRDGGQGFKFHYHLICRVISTTSTTVRPTTTSTTQPTTTTTRPTTTSTTRPSTTTTTRPTTTTTTQPTTTTSTTQPTTTLPTRPPFTRPTRPPFTRPTRPPGGR
ncbi:cubilin [Hyalella azteca]|uniref:Cubilin n=1 Tax=Hyalella azteca TaxID=294128 RepID=A0A8B7N7K7_HYAAZ|nr:cubilin [Hyalella azteca]